MIKIIDNFLNKITMYRLVLYVLIGLILVATVFGFMGILPFGGLPILFSAIFLVALGWLINTIFANVFNAPTNIESLYISALILAPIIAPIKSTTDLPFLFWAIVWTMASKFIFSINRKHIFNPVAVAVFLTSIALGLSANWWVGTASMLVPVVIGGLLIVRKTRRSDLVISFIVTALVIIIGAGVAKGSSITLVLKQIIIDSPLFFFAFIMLTEPLTTPPTGNLRIAYGILTGFLFAPQIHIGTLYTTPEIALLLGNVFSYLVSPKIKLFLHLKQKVRVAPDITDFVFNKPPNMNFTPGQYMEWTLGHPRPDNRGNRRYFTIASSPTEKELRLGIKFYNPASTFKQYLSVLNTNKTVVAAQLAGDFTLPNNPNQKCVFIAGGIGVTPFRSMIKYLVDIKQSRPITLFYSSRSAEDIVYQDVFEQARQLLGINTVYVVSDPKKAPAGWRGKIGMIDNKMIAAAVPDYQNNLYYISGPKVMIDAYSQVLAGMGIKPSQIHTDFFPGFA